MNRFIILKITYILIVLTLTVFSQTWKDDSLVIRQILDTNGLNTTTVESVVGYKDSSGRVTYLWFKDIPNFHIIPASISKLNRLGELTFETTGLTKLPKEIGDIKSLQNLCLKYNKITSLVPEIGDLPLLNGLGIDHEPGITSLPPEIGKLSRLKLFSVRFTSLSKLPDEICNLDSIKNLTLSYNKLTEIPQNIGNITSLQHVFLDYNCLKSLPQSITNLSLPPSEFDVCYNDSLVFTAEQCAWYKIKDYNDYFYKYCPVDIDNEQVLKPSAGVLSNVVLKAHSIHFTLRRTSYLKCRIYDLRGRMIEQVFSGQAKAGEHSIEISPMRSSAGVYYVVIQAGSECHKKPVAILNKGNQVY